jgi:hypothetical protein
MALRDWPTGRQGRLILEAPYLTGGFVLFQVGTALVTPTEGQLYVPIDGAVTVPIDCPELP